jgi:hypothetical protein
MDPFVFPCRRGCCRYFRIADLPAFLFFELGDFFLFKGFGGLLFGFFF